MRPSSLIHSSVVLNIAVYDRGGGGVGRGGGDDDWR